MFVKKVISIFPTLYYKNLSKRKGDQKKIKHYKKNYKEKKIKTLVYY